MSENITTAVWVGACAATASFLAMKGGVERWEGISIAGSIGAIMGAIYGTTGEPVMTWAYTKYH